jgi:putative ABC transport system substrate-binding protein
MLLALPFPARAQQVGRVYRVGYIGTGRGKSVFGDAFEQGMRERGYELGKNLIIEYRFAEGQFDRLPALAAELVRLKVDVIVTSINPTTVAAIRATSTIPVVMAFGNDPIGAGLISSLAHPGGNLTGLSMDTGDELLGKRLELLKETAGRLARVAVLYNGANTVHQLSLKNMELPARHLKITLIPVEYRESHDFEGAFKSMTAKRAGGLFLFSDGVSFDQRILIANLAVKNRFPSSYPAQEYVEAGGLESYGPNLVNNMRRAVVYVDKILKGANPGDLPVEQPMKFEFVISLKTAKQIGLTIPQWTLMKADKVIQ